MTLTPPPPRRWLALLGLAMSLCLLIPGLIARVITIRGNLEPEGVATLAPQFAFIDPAIVRKRHKIRGKYAFEHGF